MRFVRVGTKQMPIVRIQTPAHSHTGFWFRGSILKCLKATEHWLAANRNCPTQKFEVEFSLKLFSGAPTRLAGYMNTRNLSEQRHLPPAPPPRPAWKSSRAGDCTRAAAYQLPTMPSVCSATPSSLQAVHTGRS